MSRAGGPPRPADAAGRVFRAAWILPIAAPPIPDGWVAVAGGRIQACGRWPPPPPYPAGEDLGRAVILPGLVNAHTHLELSWLAGRVTPARAMPDWAAMLVEVRREAGTDDPRAMAAAMADMRAAGTAAVGDVGNSLASLEPLRAGPLAAVVFHELIGFAPADAPAIVRRARTAVGTMRETPPVRVSLGPHAPYSASAELFAAVAEEIRRSGGLPTTVHLAESPDEIEFLQAGTGRWRRLLERLGAWQSGWTPPRCGPVEFLARTGLLACRPLVVHGIHLDDGELARLAAADATVVTCPRSAAWTGAGVPPAGRFYASGVRVAIGTDSLASVADLSLFAELSALRRLAPEVPASALLASATRAGAEALGLEADYGTIEPGRAAALIAVPVPEDVEDVEEYLVGGIGPGDVRWIE